MSPRRPGTTIGEDTEPLRKLVTDFLTRYPEAQPRDVYKLIHSGTHGPSGGKGELERAAAERALDRDAQDAPATGDVIESVSIDDSVVRVNLGPYFAQGGDRDALLEGLLETAQKMEERRDQLFKLWAGFVHMNRRHEFPFARGSIDQFEVQVATANYPSVEHTKEYVELYDPRYRILLADLVPALPAGGPG